jgi:hypothetical protein
MTRYTLNNRGRAIFIYVPVSAFVIAATTTNILDLIVTWIFG